MTAAEETTAAPALTATLNSTMKDDGILEKTKEDSTNPSSTTSENGGDGIDISQEQDAAEPEYASGATLWATMAALSLVLILGGLDFSIVAVAVPAITSRFHTIADVGWYSISYRLTACVFQFAWGQIYTIFSLRWSLCVALVIFLLGSAISAAASSSIMFVIGRAITGMGSSGVLGGIFTALAVVAPLRLRPILTSLLSGLEAVAMVTGPIIGGVLTEKVSWRWCFYLNLPIGGAALVFLALFLTHGAPELESKNLTWKQVLEKMDIPANVALIGSLASLFMALSWAGSTYAWNSGTIIGLLVVFGVGLIAFVFIQFKRGDEASLAPRIMKEKTVLCSALFSFALNGALGILEYYIPIYFQTVRGWSPAKAGYMMLPVTVGSNIGLIAQGFLTTYYGYYTPFAILAAIIMPIGAGLITTWDMHTGFGELIVYTGMIGLGSGLAFEVPQIAVQTVLSEADAALGLSVTLFAQNFGGAIFISIAQQIFVKALLKNLTGKLPELDSETVQNLGLVDLPKPLPGVSQQDVLLGIEQSFIQIYYIAVALACVMVLGTIFMGWDSVKTEEEKPEVKDNNIQEAK